MEENLKLYHVEITSIAVVAAKDVYDALNVADRNRGSITSDDTDPATYVIREVVDASMLPDGWDAHCLPYGTRDAANIGKYLTKT